MLFRSKIQPYCAFTINLGPQYVERVFDSLLTQEGVGNIVFMPAANRLEKYLQYLHKNSRSSSRRQYSFIQFYTGHFAHQLAGQRGRQEDSWHLYEKALCHYEIYLELAVDESESRYYAQWQTAVLQDHLAYPWSQTESSLLKATTLDPLRGEPVKKLIGHCCKSKAWKPAYALSMMAIKKYLDKNPVSSRRWFVDFSAYNWSLLHTHLYICYKLGKIQEAAQMYQQLVDYVYYHPDDLSTSDIRFIHGLKRLFHDRKANNTMAAAS